MLLHPRDPELHLAMAQVEGLEGDSEEAAQCLMRASALGADPERVEFDRRVLEERR